MSTQKDNSSDLRPVEKGRYSRIKINKYSMSARLVERFDSFLSCTEPIELVKVVQSLYYKESMQQLRKEETGYTALNDEQMQVLGLLMTFIADIEEERFRLPQRINPGEITN